MRQYDDLIDVRRGMVAGRDAPEQFVWHGKLWVVRQIIAHWVRTGAWWEQSTSADLLAEREIWRVEAGAGRSDTVGVYDLGRDVVDDGGDPPDDRAALGVSRGDPDDVTAHWRLLQVTD